MLTKPVNWEYDSQRPQRKPMSLKEHVCTSMNT
jgi:hypothetical protein